MKRQIAIIWKLEDVQSARPDLNDEQAMQVLERVEKSHDAAIGVNWDVIRECTNDMFKPEYKKFKRFIDYLKSGVILDCELIIGDVDMPASFVWDEDSRITHAGYQKFKSLMDSQYEVLENGNIEVFCDDDKLGEKFVYAAAGYVSEESYKSWFEGEWCK